MESRWYQRSLEEHKIPVPEGEDIQESLYSSDEKKNYKMHACRAKRMRIISESDIETNIIGTSQNVSEFRSSFLTVPYGKNYKSVKLTIIGNCSVKNASIFKLKKQD